MRRSEVDEVPEWFPDALAEADLKTGNPTYVNHLFTVLTGYAPGDLAVGVSALTLFDVASQVQITETIQQELKLVASAEFHRANRRTFIPVILRRNDGSEFADEVHGSYVLDERRRPRAVCFVLRDMKDVTSLRRELELKDSSRENLRHLSPVGIFHMGLEGHITEVNRRLVEITGMTPEGLLGHGYLESFHPDYLAHAVATIREAIATPDPEPRIPPRKQATRSRGWRTLDPRRDDEPA